MKLPSNALNTHLIRESYLKFNVASLAGMAGDVGSAILRARVTGVHSAGVDVQVRGVANSTWSESSITYNTKPAYDAEVITTTGVDGVDTGLWKEWDVTSYIVNQLEFSPVFLSLAMTADDTRNNHVGFYRSEKGSAVELVVTRAGFIVL